MSNTAEIFGCMAFNDDVQRQRLPARTYRQLRETIKDSKRLDPEVANIVANAMKDWAVENGATHFTHWFQPLNGVTAEKHDSFISNAGGGRVILEFSGSNLVRGEPDASSFPSGGLRATFEARGYTAWDPTSYAFIKDNTLYIPTAFCSYTGEALDRKTPLLRSMQALNTQCMRILRLFGNTDVRHVKPTCGPAQEYCRVDEAMFERRPDLMFTGRTLFGAMPPKGQELDDHYFGVIKPKVAEFMKDLDEELWKLGVLAKTEHNEVAPSQHELAPVFITSNVAVDHNQLTMEMMKKVARRHGLVCLLHEKPFEGVNGSGKHNNWSLKTDTGANLLEPGDTPYENAQFLLFLCAVIKAVDDYQDLLRIAVSSAGNDHRLGASEAPPAIVSIFLGDELTEILEAIDNGTAYSGKEKTILKIGVNSIPHFARDTTDRNRTSPFAFTGNKFEFRMPGSSASMSTPNVALNTAVAEALRQFADELEAAGDFTPALHALIRSTIHEHRRIIFNGNGYEDAWVAEAQKRGLHNYPSTPEALPHMLDEKNVALYTGHGVLSRAEIQARYEVGLENYSKLVKIEARTMQDMAKRQILPAVSAFGGALARTLQAKKACGTDVRYESETLDKVSALTGELYHRVEGMNGILARAAGIGDSLKLACFCRDSILPAMTELREIADALETVTGPENWPFPTYGELLFGVK
ncbi:MAG: glutamine synthetase III [Oscillospiraceae bacterium]|nr:glutamine synthetase III [Oscillospiraceae bacterium]